MSTRNVLVAFAVVSLSVVAALFVACSDSGPNCKPNTLALQVELDGTANAADTIEVSSGDPAFTQTMTRTSGDFNLFTVDVGFGGTYPAGKAVTLIVRAKSGQTILGENVAVIHLADGCSTGFVAVRAETLDAGFAD